MILYLIIVYDVGVERLNAVRQYLRTQLNWVQNSVFEGPATQSQLEEIKKTLLDIIDKSSDSIIFYILRNKKVMKKKTLGVSKGAITNII